MSQWERSAYIRVVWQALNDLQNIIDQDNGHYVCKDTVLKDLQRLKDALREDLKTIGTGTV